MEKFIRLCPNCNREREYKNYKALNKAIQENRICQSCAAKKDHQKKKLEGRNTKKRKKKIITNNEFFVRNCPNCKKEIHYKKSKSFEQANKKDSKCRSCTMKETNSKVNRTGKNNSMYGRSVYDVWTERYGIKEANRKKEIQLNKISEASKNKLNLDYLIDKHGEKKGRDIYKNHLKQIEGWIKNGRGKNNFRYLVEKYGEEEAIKRYEKWKSKISNATSGENNPMYGRPAPMGSGNGWKGHYKDIYFASLRELFYLKYLLDNNIKFENGEKRKYKVPYEFMGKTWNYFLDFYLLETNEYIEIKPTNLVNSPKNSAKFKAAKEMYGDKFKVITDDDLQQISTEEMYQLYLSKELIFLKKYEEKFLDYYENHKE